MRARVCLALTAALAVAACGGSGSAPAAKSVTHQQQSPNPVPTASVVVPLGQAGQAADVSGNAWRITVSNPVLVAPFSRDPNVGLHVVVYRVTVANTRGKQDVTSTDFEERVTGYPLNDLWSGGGTEATLQRFMVKHKFIPEPPAAGSPVTEADPSQPRSYYVAITYSGKLSQVELRPFGWDDSWPSPLIWR